jgi:hypothetical protein
VARSSRTAGILRLDTRQPNEFTLIRDTRGAQWVVLSVAAVAVANGAFVLHLSGQKWLAIGATLIAASAALALVFLAVQHRPFTSAALWLSRSPFRNDTLSASVELTLRHPPSSATVRIVWLRGGAEISAKESDVAVTMRGRTPLIRFPMDGDSTAEELQLTVRRASHLLASFNLRNKRTA